MAKETPTKQKAPKTVKVFAPTQKGSILSLPHTEQRATDKNGEYVGRQVVDFDTDGYAEVAPEIAAALFEHYHNVVVPV